MIKYARATPNQEPASSFLTETKPVRFDCVGLVHKSHRRLEVVDGRAMRGALEKVHSDHGGLQQGVVIMREGIYAQKPTVDSLQQEN